MKSVRLSGLIGLLAAFTAFLFVSGCEEGPDVTEATSYFDNNSMQSIHEDIATYSLTIIWADVIQQTAGLTIDGEVAVFKAAGGKPPYKWSARDVSLGTVVEQNNASTAYQRNAVGDNLLILKDSAGVVAYAAISQP